MNVALRTIAVGAVLSIPAAILCFFAWGQAGALGLLLGSATALLSLASLHLLAWTIGPTPSDNRSVTRLTLILWVLKLPIIFGCVWLASTLGGNATACFLGGLALVYSCLVHAGLRHQ